MSAIGYSGTTLERRTSQAYVEQLSVDLYDYILREYPLSADVGEWYDTALAVTTRLSELITKARQRYEPLYKVVRKCDGARIVP